MFSKRLQRIFMVRPVQIRLYTYFGERVQNIPEDYTVDEEINVQQAMDTLRSFRNGLLERCDWTQLPDVEMPEEQAIAWRQYRKKLRDFPASVDEVNWTAPDWPLAPGEIELVDNETIYDWPPEHANNLGGTEIASNETVLEVPSENVINIPEDETTLESTPDIASHTSEDVIATDETTNEVLFENVTNVPEVEIATNETTLEVPTVNANNEPEGEIVINEITIESTPEIANFTSEDEIAINETILEVQTESVVSDEKYKFINRITIEVPTVNVINEPEDV